VRKPSVELKMRWKPISLVFYISVHENLTAKMYFVSQFNENISGGKMHIVFMQNFLYLHENPSPIGWEPSYIQTDVLPVS
jgi:hypothetical protein